MNYREILNNKKRFAKKNVSKSIAIQRGNTMSILKTLPTSEGLDEVLFSFDCQFHFKKNIGMRFVIYSLFYWSKPCRSFGIYQDL